MGLVTLQVLDGFEMGQVFENLATPVSIGRERDNDVALNDEQVSRFHAKIQDADGRLILTDLDSTNGTRVNGGLRGCVCCRRGPGASGAIAAAGGGAGQSADALLDAARQADDDESPDAGQMTRAVQAAETRFPTARPQCRRG